MHVKRRGRTSVNAIDAGPRCDRESGGAIYNIIRSKNTMRVDIFRRRRISRTRSWLTKQGMLKLDELFKIYKVKHPYRDVLAFIILI